MTHYCCTFLVYKICLEKVSLLTDFLKVCFTPKSFILFPTVINCTHALPFIFVDCYRKVNIELLNHIAGLSLMLKRIWLALQNHLQTWINHSKPLQNLLTNTLFFSDVKITVELVSTEKKSAACFRKVFGQSVISSYQSPANLLANFWRITGGT